MGDLPFERPMTMTMAGPRSRRASREGEKTNIAGAFQSAVALPFHRYLSLSLARSLRSRGFHPRTIASSVLVRWGKMGRELVSAFEGKKGDFSRRESERESATFASMSSFLPGFSESSSVLAKKSKHIFPERTARPQMASPLMTANISCHAGLRALVHRFLANWLTDDLKRVES